MKHWCRIATVVTIYIDNRNIYGIYLYKDELHLVESGKTILVRNFIFYLNNYFYAKRMILD